MANEPYTITNQKLYFVKLTLADWQTAIIESQANPTSLKPYHERVVFHFYSSLWAIYNEIASFYRFPLLTQPLSLKQFLTAEFIAQNPSPELNELVTLFDDNSSFLSLIDKAWQDMFNPTVTKQASSNIIPVKQLTNSLDTLEDAKVCLKELSELIVRFRAGLSEY